MSILRQFYKNKICYNLKKLMNVELIQHSLVFKNEIYFHLNIQLF